MNWRNDWNLKRGYKRKTMKLESELKELHKNMEIILELNDGLKNENNILKEKMNTRIVRLSNRLYKFIGKLRRR